MRDSLIEKKGVKTVIGILAVLFMVQACQKNAREVDPSSEKFKDAVSSFHLGLAAAQTNKMVYAVDKMTNVADMYPSEPAVWANLGVMALRQGNFKLAEKRLKEARKLAPKNGRIEFLIGYMMSRKGEIEEAIDHLEKAYKLAPENIRITYTLAKELERASEGDKSRRIRTLLTKILEQEPGNRVVLLDLMRRAAQSNDKELLQQYFKRIKKYTGETTGELREQFDKLEKAIDSGDMQSVTTEVAFMANVLQQQTTYQKEISSVKLPQNQIGFLFAEFLKLPMPPSGLESPDTGLTFDSQLLDKTRKGRSAWQWVRASSLTGGLQACIIRANDNQVEINGKHTFAFPGSINKKSYLSEAIAVIDYNYDFLNDLALAGSKGFRLYKQLSDSSFADVTAQTDLPKSVINEKYRGVWTVDIEMDGDLDLVLAPASGTPVTLRNNGDGTFTTRDQFNEIEQMQDLTWGDLDSDGDIDLVFRDRDGKITLYLNERTGEYSKKNISQLPDSVRAMEIGDLNRDGMLDLVTVNDEYLAERHWFDDQDKTWKSEDISEVDEFDNYKDLQLFLEDMDNNGGEDLVLSASEQTNIILQETDSTFVPLNRSFPVTVTSIIDMNGDQRLDLVGVSDENELVQLINKGSKSYHARIIRPRASGVSGDRRINSYGIGSKLEVRSGLMYQKKLVKSPLVHVGLGNYEKAELVRVIWPNGSVQAEFAELDDSSILGNEQSLKGSCPWLFAYNGEEMEFVTDLLWRSPLGLRINAQKTAGVVQTEDRVKIDGDQLKENNGYYELRVTAELWETHFFDKLSLMAVDHPENQEIFVNERFAFPPPSLKAHPTSSLHPVSKVLDDEGREVTDIIRNRDAQYLHHFEHTKYQGVTEDHYIEIHLPEDLSSEKPLWLVLFGWVKPTDSSINLALSQGSNESPRGISVEVFDGEKWKTVKSDLGFPAGKSKSVLIDLQEVLDQTRYNKLRLRTTTETYWNQIAWADGRPDIPIKRQKLKAQMKKLRYRGFSQVKRANSSAPEIPEYDTLAGTTQKWRDLIGFYTRYGDVGELLQKVDDRYVIMNAGDEMILRFKAPASPPEGWERDFVLIQDGWVKDGDYNTEFSKTVLPLPSHKQNTYDRPPTTLEEDPVYQRHREDWVKYHTRYVTPEIFEQAMKLQ